MERTCLAVVLAAGDSTRMKSSMSKVLHPVGRRPMIAHVMEAIARADIGSAEIHVQQLIPRGHLDAVFESGNGVVRLPHLQI